MNADPAADPPTFDYDPGYPQTYERDFDNVYDRVTVRDIADLLHHPPRCAAAPATASTTSSIPPSGPRSCPARPTLFTRIAQDAERTGVDDYSRQVRQMATDARTAAEQAQLQLPQQQVGPDQRRTSARPLTSRGARSEENSGATSG